MTRFGRGRVGTGHMKELKKEVDGNDEQNEQEMSHFALSGRLSQRQSLSSPMISTSCRAFNPLAVSSSYQFLPVCR